MNTQSLLKPQAAAEALNISKRTLYRMIRAKKIAIVKLPSGATRIHPDALAALIAQSTIPAHTPTGAGQASTQENGPCQQSANQGNVTRMESMKGRTRPIGGPTTPAATAGRFAVLLAFDAKTIQERKKQRPSGPNGS